MQGGDDGDWEVARLPSHACQRRMIQTQRLHGRKAIEYRDMQGRPSCLVISKVLDINVWPKVGIWSWNSLMFAPKLQATCPIHLQLFHWLTSSACQNFTEGYPYLSWGCCQLIFLWHVIVVPFNKLCNPNTRVSYRSERSPTRKNVKTSKHPYWVQSLGLSYWGQPVTSGRLTSTGTWTSCF